jgi:hypothetical protein
MGIISLSVFVCLIVVSYSLFGVFSVAYIAGGIIVYGFLMESLLRKPNKFAVLGYVTFEVKMRLYFLSIIERMKYFKLTCSLISFVLTHFLGTANSILSFPVHLHYHTVDLLKY